jgi:sugar-phosphatase
MSRNGHAANPVRGVIFDMDGLIVDSEPFWRRVEAACFDELGADIRPFLGHGYTMGLRVDEAVHFLVEASGLAGIDEEALASRIVSDMVATITAEAVLFPGVYEALDLFANLGLRIALASGSTPPVIDAVLRRFDLTSRFDLVCSAIDDDLGKPHPSIFLRAATLLSIEPTSMLVLEDSLNGVISAKAARMRVVAVPHPDDAGDPRFSLADLVLGSLLELPEHLGEVGIEIPASIHRQL